LEDLTALRGTLEQKLADPAVYADDAKSRLLQLLADKQRVDAELGDVEAQWLDAGEELERLQSETAP
jgi:hypothetical protein